MEILFEWQHTGEPLSVPALHPQTEPGRNSGEFVSCAYAASGTKSFQRTAQQAGARADPAAHAPQPTSKPSSSVPSRTGTTVSSLTVTHQTSFRVTSARTLYSRVTQPQRTLPIQDEPEPVSGAEKLSFRRDIAHHRPSGRDTHRRPRQTGKSPADMVLLAEMA